MEWEPHIKFFIDNYRDIDAVIELKNRAKVELVEELCRKISSAIKLAASSWQGVAVSIVKPDPDNIQVWWADQTIYDEENDVGPYFGVHPLSLDALIAQDVSHVTPNLYWSLGTGATKGPLSLPRSRIQQVVERLRSKSWLHIGSYDKGEPVTAYEPVGDIMNIEALIEPGSMLPPLVARARRFTEEIVAALKA